MPVAQYVLGCIYEAGQGVSADLATARELYARAVEGGLGCAAVQLGLHHYWGRGTDRNYALAAKWFRHGAELGDPMSQQSLATQLRVGEGIEADIEKAIVWLLRAAKQGCASAQQDLAAAYWFGQGVDQDFDQAYFWIGVGATHETAVKELENIVALRKKFARKVGRAPPTRFAGIAHAGAKASHAPPSQSNSRIGAGDARCPFGQAAARSSEATAFAFYCRAHSIKNAWLG